MGAAAVFDTPAATPDNIKFSKNPSFFSPILNKLNHTERVKIQVILLRQLRTEWTLGKEQWRSTCRKQAQHMGNTFKHFFFLLVHAQCIYAFSHKYVTQMIRMLFHSSTTFRQLREAHHLIFYSQMKNTLYIDIRCHL